MYKYMPPLFLHPMQTMWFIEQLLDYTRIVGDMFLGQSECKPARAIARPELSSFHHPHRQFWPSLNRSGEEEGPRAISRLALHPGPSHSSSGWEGPGYKTVSR